MKRFVSSKKSRLIVSIVAFAGVVSMFQNCGNSFEVLGSLNLAQVSNQESTTLPGGLSISTTNVNFEKQQSDVNLKILRPTADGYLGYSFVLRRFVRINLAGNIVETLNLAPDRNPEVINSASRFGFSPVVVFQYLDLNLRARLATWNTTTNVVTAVSMGDDFTGSFTAEVVGGNFLITSGRKLLRISSTGAPIGTVAQLSQDISLYPHSFVSAGPDRLIGPDPTQGFAQLLSVNLANGQVSPFIAGLNTSSFFFHPGRNSVIYAEQPNGNQAPRVLERVVGSNTDTVLGTWNETLTFDSTDGSFIATLPDTTQNAVLYSPRLAAGSLSLGMPLDRRYGIFRNPSKILFLAPGTNQDPAPPNYVPYIIDLAAPAAPRVCNSVTHNTADGSFSGSGFSSSIINSNCTELLEAQGTPTATIPPTPYTLTLVRKNLSTGVDTTIRAFNSDGVANNSFQGILGQVGVDYFYAFENRLYRIPPAGAPVEVGQVARVNNYYMSPNAAQGYESVLNLAQGRTFVLSVPAARAAAFSSPRSLLTPTSINIKATGSDGFARVSREPSRDDLTSETLLIQYFDSNGAITRAERIATGLTSVVLEYSFFSEGPSPYAHVQISGRLDNVEREMIVSVHMPSSTFRTMLVPPMTSSQFIGRYTLASGDVINMYRDLIQGAAGEVTTRFVVCSMPVTGQCRGDMFPVITGGFVGGLFDFGNEVVVTRETEFGRYVRQGNGSYIAGPVHPGYPLFTNGTKSKIYIVERNGSNQTYATIDLATGVRSVISGLSGRHLRTSATGAIFASGSGTNALTWLDFATDSTTAISNSTFVGVPTLYPPVDVGDFSYVNIYPLEPSNLVGMVVDTKLKTIVGRVTVPAGSRKEVAGSVGNQILLVQSAINPTPAQASKLILLDPATMKETDVDTSGITNVAVGITDRVNTGKVVFFHGVDSNKRHVSAYLDPSIGPKLHIFKTQERGFVLRDIVQISPKRIFMGFAPSTVSVENASSYLSSPGYHVEPGVEWTLVSFPK